MLDLGTSAYQRFGSQILKATCESHRKSVHPRPSLAMVGLVVKLPDARIKSEMNKCIKDDYTG